VLLLLAAALQSRILRIHLARGILRLGANAAGRILDNVERERGQ
jgi:hypothetical protein